MYVVLSIVCHIFLAPEFKKCLIAIQMFQKLDWRAAAGFGDQVLADFSKIGTFEVPGFRKDVTPLISTSGGLRT